MTEENGSPADRPATDAGAAKARGFADRVRLGVQIDKARQVQADIRKLEAELLQFAERLGVLAGSISGLISGLEAERSGGAREPAGN